MSKRKVLVTKKVWSQGYSKPPIIEEVGIGEFHCWGCNCEESESNFGNYTIAIVEMLDGSILTPLPENIKFLNQKDSKINKDLLDACIKANQYLAYIASEGKLYENEVNNWSDTQNILHKAIIKAKKENYNEQSQTI